MSDGQRDDSKRLVDSLLVSPKRPRVDDDELEEGGRDRASDQSDDSDASENEAREGEEGQEPESDDDDNGPEDPRAPWSERERAALAKYSQLKAEFPNAKGHASLAAALLPGRSLDDIEAAIQSSTVKAHMVSSRMRELDVAMREQRVEAARNLLKSTPAVAK